MIATTARRGARRYVFRSAWRRGAAALLDAAGAALVRFLTLGRGLRPDADVLAQPKNILLVRLDHLGDVLFARPCLQALRGRYPQAHLTVLTSSLGAELLRRDPHADEIIVWDAPWFARGGASVEGPGYWRLVKDLRRRRFDLSLELRGDLRQHVLLWLAGVRVRIGYGITGGAFLLHRPLPLAAGIHEVERDLAAAAAAGAEQFPRRFTPLALDAGERQTAERVWQGSRRRVVVHPAAGDPAKCWPPERFAAVCDALADAGGEIILVGTARERAIAEAVVRACLRPPRNLCGTTTVAELLALVTTAQLLVGNDSGPAHVAVTQDVPAVILWSETNAPEEWGPWGEGCRAAVVREPGRPEAAAEVVAAAKHFLGL
jgi:ADP-heptose:LPS heptosyltransferase